jgi:hypothetical protein
MQSVRRSPAFAFSKGRQRGQALIFGLFVLIAGLAALFFFFNVGQLSREKTKLVNTADAVAYSAGVVQARALNFNAYSNRALIANEVLIAQMVSLSSWADYVDSWAANLPGVHPECVAAANGNWVAAAGLFKFGVDYFLGCAALQLASQSNLVAPVTGAIRTSAAVAIPAIEVNKAALMAAQTSINLSLVAERALVMNAVASANYAGDGVVSVDLFSPTLADDWQGIGGSGPFVQQYSGSERTRFREVAVAAANTDPFIQQRSWTSRSLLPDPGCLTIAIWDYDEVRRRGGTELLGFDEWRAVDTQSYHNRFRRKLRCREQEIPTGVGEQQAFKPGFNQSPGAATFGESLNHNPAAHSQAVSGASGTGMGYTGLPTYHDLNQVWINGSQRDEDPKLLHGVRLTRSATNLRTTDGTTGQIRTRSDSRISAYDTAVAGGEMAAVSTSEVYFERPAAQANNIFGAHTYRPRELGSLFNPYWQVRLASSNAVGEWLRQGVTP